MKPLLSFALAATLAVSVAAFPAPVSASAKSCAGIPKLKITKLKAGGVSCAKARKVAKGWKRTGKSKGFDCGYYPIKNKKQIERVRCEKGGAVVTFTRRWVAQMPFPTFPPIQPPSPNS